MSGFTSEGIVKNMSLVEKKSETLTVQDIVLEIPDKYPQLVLFQFKNDRTEQLKDLKVGDNVRIHWNLRGREFNGKFYTSLDGWRVEKLQAPAQAQGSGLPF